ncbi:MAG: alpha/beta fold hydrolase [Deltaproteobacteria bacterium]|nr:alpha/beta fold hydrolase [Deltaproteobacteria bacterium]
MGRGKPFVGIVLRTTFLSSFAARRRAPSSRSALALTGAEAPHNLLLMHGWAGSANNWDGVIKALDPRKFRAIACDLRGHRDSDPAATGFTDERLARDALAIADASGARRFTAVGFSISGRLVQYLRLLVPERVEAMAIIAGCPASPMELPDAMIVDWVARAGDRQKLREIPLRFAINPDLELLEEWANDAVKVSRHALEATLRLLLSPFQHSPPVRSPAIPALVLAGIADALLGPTVQRAIDATYPGSQMVEFECAHEFLIEAPSETAEQVARFVAALPRPAHQVRKSRTRARSAN